MEMNRDIFLRRYFAPISSTFQELADTHGISRHRVEKIAKSMADDLRKYIESFELRWNRVQAAENSY